MHPAELYMGYNQVGVLMDVYLDRGKFFDTIPARPVVAQRHCHQVKMRSHVQGVLQCDIPSQSERIKALPSYLEHFFTVRPGDQILKSIDMPSIPGEITLLHMDKDVLTADYQKLSEILAEGIFQVLC